MEAPKRAEQNLGKCTVLEVEGRSQLLTWGPGPEEVLHTHFGQGPRPPPLTCRRKRSASAALPVAIHWNEAFWPALTSTSPRREK